MKIVSERPLLTFFVLTWLLSWPFWIASGVLGRRGGGPLDFHWLVAQIGVFGPALAALIVSGTVREELRKNSVRNALLFLPVLALGIFVAAGRPSSWAKLEPLASILTVILAAVVVLFFSPWNRRLLNPGTGERYERPGAVWFVLAVLFFPCLFLLAWMMTNLRGGTWGVSALQSGAWGFSRLATVAFAANLLFGGSLGEEPGWRGFALPRLLQRHSPLVASLILAVMWALWHAPLDLSAGFLVKGPAALVVRIIWTLPLTILFTWFYVRSRGSLLVALLLHTSVNIIPDLGFSNLEGSFVVFGALCGVAATVVPLSRRMLQKESEAREPRAL